MGESRNHFLNVSGALDASDGRPKGGVVPARILAQSEYTLGRDLPEGKIGAVKGYDKLLKQACL